jgi:hypothetical protein
MLARRLATIAPVMPLAEAVLAHIGGWAPREERAARWSAKYRGGLDELDATRAIKNRRSA